MTMPELELMRREWVDVTRKNGFREGITDLLAHQYSKKTHFIFELLQNAEDACATEVAFRVESHRLVFSHNGKHGFTEADVESITSIGNSTKQTDYTQIGKHGIGFKAVFAYTHAPRIHSGDKHFDIEDVVIPRFLRDEEAPNDLKSGETRIVLPFDSDAIPEDGRFRKLVPAETAMADISDALKKLNIRTLLFLRHIEEIHWSLVGGAEGAYLRESRPNPCRTALRHVDVTDGDRTESWCVFEEEVTVEDDGEDHKCIVEVGFLIENDKVIRAQNTELVVYFPTEKKTGLGFLVQGPFKTTKARDNIKSDDEANKQMLTTAARLAAESLNTLCDLNLLDVSSYHALPLQVPEDSFFSPVYDSVRKKLGKEPLLPADDGTFVSAENTRLAGADWLRKLLQGEQLSLLFGLTAPTWISGKITERTMPDLWKYIRDVLKIEEVTPDSFARKVDEPFFEKQTDEWMTRFYKRLLGHKSLWKDRRESPYDTGPLRAKRFIRLKDGKHVEAFRHDGTPNVYLSSEFDNDTPLQIVKFALTQDEDARRFLTDLGIPELDVVEEVIEHILPKYSGPLINIFPEVNEHDIARIEQAYRTDSQEKKGRLKQALQKSYFLRAHSPGSDNFKFRRPGSVYFPDKALEIYFTGYDAVGFICSDYEAPTREMLKDLGVSEEVRVTKRCPGFNGFVELVNSHGWHKRGVHEFDPDIRVEGLEHALASPSLAKSEYIWNRIVAPHPVYIRGTVEASTRQTYANAEKEERISLLGTLLIEKSWLPDPEGRNFRKPGELRLEDLPDSFKRDRNLAEQLKMLSDAGPIAPEVAVGREQEKVAKAFGFGSAEEARESAELIQKDRAGYKRLLEKNKERPLFPNRPVIDPDRRQERLEEQFADAPERSYEQRTRSVHITEATEDTRVWLKGQYTNDEGKMVCQICKEEMPFKKRNGEYYFEAVEALSREFFAKVHEAQFLALCPLCAAKYKEFVKHDKDAMVKLKNDLLDCNGEEVLLILGEEEGSIRFVETHLLALKTILGAT